ncbi:acidic mammalian chitinase-like [Mytilus californianus]|uniref:acidic mammalian chitinase-like n=1 Tax=Mytilus californianus TaxID=6549 RepID=UPI002246E9D4|nr:acidic mammalian chitinase-like [Mytilus californianus]
MFFLRVTLVLLAAVSVASAYRRVCYYTNWAQYRNSAGKFFPENVDPTLCTHIIYSFAKMVGNKLHPYEWNDESTPWMKGMYARFTDLKKSNPSLKLELAVGGWNMASAPFTRMVASASSRQEFATSTVKFLRDHGFDGLDLDWEYPANRGSPPGDKQKFIELLKTLRREFDAEAQTSGKPALLLSAATPAGKENIDSGYNFPEMVKYLDMFNLMTYDLHGSWEDKTGHHSPLYSHPSESGNKTYLNIDWVTKYYVKNGVPPSMINVGLGLYGRSFTLASASNTGLGAPARGAGPAGQFTREKGFLAYYEVCAMLKSGGSKHYIPEQKSPYAVKGTEWVGYDDVDSLKEKVKYIKDHHFGGTMVWALDLDDFSGSCGQGKYPLLHAINDELNAAGGTNVKPVTNAPQPTTQAPQPTTQAPQHTNNPTQPTTQPPRSTTRVPQPTQAQQVTTKGPRPTHQAHHVGPTTNFNCNGRKSGFYPSPSACDSYYICAASLAFEVKCASGLLFNSVSKYCDSQYNVKCSTSQNPQPTTKAPFTQAPVVTTRKAVATQAPGTQAPIVITQAPVTQAPVVITQAPSNGNNKQEFCKNKPDGHYRDPTDCGEFYQCSFGLTFHEYCAPGTVFNEQLVSCDYPIHVPGCLNYGG